MCVCFPGWAVRCKNGNACLCASCALLYASMESSPGDSENAGLPYEAESEDAAVSPLPCLGSLTTGTSAACDEDTQAAQWRDPHREDTTAPLKEAHMVRNCSRLPTPGTPLPGMCVSYPQSRRPQCRPTPWQNHVRDRETRIISLRCSWVPSPKNLCEITNSVLCG